MLRWWKTGSTRLPQQVIFPLLPPHPTSSNLIQPPPSSSLLLPPPPTSSRIYPSSPFSDPPSCRLWKYFESRYSSKEFFKKCYMTTYCPAMYVDDLGKEVWNNLRNLFIISKKFWTAENLRHYNKKISVKLNFSKVWTIVVDWHIIPGDASLSSSQAQVSGHQCLWPSYHWRGGYTETFSHHGCWRLHFWAGDI